MKQFVALYHAGTLHPDPTQIRLVTQGKMHEDKTVPTKTVLNIS